jgi:hypothetical protein
MINAKIELEQELEKIGKTIENIIAINIVYGSEYYYQGGKEIIKSEKVLSIDCLDFEYDDGYGGQMLFGRILFDDNTWLTRGEYDGSEWWSYNEPPTIKSILED